MESGETQAPITNGNPSSDAKTDAAKPPPSLSDKQAEIIINTWAKVKAGGLEQAGIILFKKLFEIAPELINLFPFTEEDVGITSPALVKHGFQVMESIDAAIDLLSDAEELVETLKTLGIVHNMHNVQLESFAPVGQALVYTLATGLKDDFTEEVQAAWITLYTIVQHFMTLGMTEGLNA